MKHILSMAAAAVLSLLGTSALAADSESDAYALHAECTASYYGPADKAGSYAYNDPKADAKSEYKGEYKGEYRNGRLVSCTDQQYTAYLETVDPMRIMNAYPTAAGRPAAVTKALDKNAKKPSSKETSKPVPDAAPAAPPSKY